MELFGRKTKRELKKAAAESDNDNNNKPVVGAWKLKYKL